MSRPLGSLAFVLMACSGQASSHLPEDDGDTSALLASANPINNPCSLEQCTTVLDRAGPKPGPACPAAEPAAGATCSVASLTCAYGDSISSFCRREYVCEEQIWQAQQSACVTQPSGFCPRQPQPGEACTTGEFELFFVPCEYEGGITCNCVGNPLQQAGIEGQWECYGPPPNAACPAVLPNIGSGCAQNGQSCRYGIVESDCYSPYASVYCYQGAWEAAEAACAQ